MASVTIRNLDHQLKQHLRVRAAQHGRSMEDEVRKSCGSRWLRRKPRPGSRGGRASPLCAFWAGSSYRPWRASRGESRRASSGSPRYRRGLGTDEGGARSGGHGLGVGTGRDSLFTTTITRPRSCTACNSWRWPGDGTVSKPRPEPCLRSILPAASCLLTKRRPGSCRDRGDPTQDSGGRRAVRRPDPRRSPVPWMPASLLGNLTDFELRRRGDRSLARMSRAGAGKAAPRSTQGQEMPEVPS